MILPAMDKYGNLLSVRCNDVVAEEHRRDLREDNTGSGRISQTGSH